MAKRIDHLVEDFGLWVHLYDSNDVHCGHIRTIALLRSLGVARAIDDSNFLALLDDTLSDWDAFRPVRKPTVQTLRAGLAGFAGSIRNLQYEQLDDPHLNAAKVGSSVASLVVAGGAALGKPRTPLVLGSKTLHHLLPDLVPPIDP